MTAMMIEAAVRALVLAALVGVGLRLLRVTNVPVLKAAWTVVLLASCAMPVLMRWPATAGWANRVGWAVPLPVRQAPALSTADAGTPVVRATIESDTAAMPSAAESAGLVSAGALRVPVAPSPSETAVARDAGGWTLPPLSQLVVWLYGAVAAALLLRLLWGLGVALRIWTTAEEVSPLVAPEPHVRISKRIPSPVTIGSGVVLPAESAEWDREKLRVVLAHERSHVRQQDFYLQLLAGLYAALFWFSPLGWWLRRTLASLGEAIGDRAGLDAARSRSGYAEIVLEFAAMPRRNLPGVAMARTGNISKRIEQLLNEPLFQRAFAEGKRRALVSLLLIPAALFAVTALVRVPSASAQSAAAVPAPDVAPALKSAPSPGAAGAAAAQSPGSAPDAAPVAQVAPDRPAAPAPAAGPAAAPAPAVVVGDQPSATAVLKDGRTVTEDGNGASAFVEDDGADVGGYDYELQNGGDSWALVGSSTHFSFSGRWQGNLPAQIERARRMEHGPFLWFWHDGKSYIVDDPAIVERLQAMNQPIRELGREQEELGKQQEELGREQEKLARDQEQSARVRMPDLSKEIAKLDAEMAQMKAEQGQMVTQEKLGQMQSEVAELQARLGELQGQAGAVQGDFGAKMGKLGQLQGDLGRQQGKLGSEQGRLARETNQKVHSIIDEALRDGKARPVQ